MSDVGLGLPGVPPLAGQPLASAGTRRRHVDHWFAADGCVDQLEPVEAVAAEGEEVRQLADRRERHPAEQLDRHLAGQAGQLELDGLGEAAEVVHAEHDSVSELSEEGQDRGVLGREDLEAPEPEDVAVLAADLEHPLHPV